MKIKNYLLLCLVAMLAVTACKKHSTPKPSTTVKMDTDVYVSGTIRSQDGHDMAALWKNGILDTLSPDPAQDWDATGVAVYNGKVYVSGYQYVSGTNTKAAYWVDGQKHDLSTNANAVANGIGVNDDGIYTEGTVNNNIAVYWKGGDDSNYITLPTIAYGNDSYAQANGVYASGHNFYIAGYVGGGTAAYWKNDTLVDLGKGANGYANAIASDGTNVYTVGIDENASPDSAAYWKNGESTTHLTTSSKFDSNANAVAVSGNDIYVVGNTYDSNVSGKVALPQYWKNGESISFPGAGALSGIAVVGNTVFITGYTPNYGPPAYWKNGVKLTLSGSKNYYTTGIAVAVHPH